MAKTAGHYSGWVKREAVKRNFTGPIGVTTTPKGNKIVAFARPPRINARKLDAAFDALSKKTSGARA